MPKFQAIRRVSDSCLSSRGPITCETVKIKHAKEKLLVIINITIALNLSSGIVFAGITPRNHPETVPIVRDWRYRHAQDRKGYPGNLRWRACASRRGFQQSRDNFHNPGR